VKAETLWSLINGPVKELLRHSLEDISLSFVTDKEENMIIVVLLDI